MVQIVHSREELEHLLVSMHVDGWAIRALARHFKMGRNTVRTILRAHQRARDKGHDLLKAYLERFSRPSKLDSFMPLIKELLEEFPDIRGQRVYEELKAAGYSGGITIVRDRLQKLKVRPKEQPTTRFGRERDGNGDVLLIISLLPFGPRCAERGTCQGMPE